MTDQELLQLLAEKSPRELTDDEITELRQRAKVSPEIRAAIAELVHFESGLTSTLSAGTVSIDRLLGRAEERRRRQTERQRHRTWWALIGLTVCVCFVAGFWRWTTQADVGKSQQPDAALAGNSTASSTKSDGDTDDREKATPSDHTIVADTLMAQNAQAAISKQPSVPVAAKPKTEDNSTSASVGPWQPWIDGTQPPLAADDLALASDLMTMQLDRLLKTEFEAWWEQVPGEAWTTAQEQFSKVPVTKLDGWARLKAPWLDDTCLRFLTFDDKNLTLYFWQGLEGVALRRYRECEPQTWAAFRVKRDAESSVRPIRWGLLTTDSGAMHRSGAQAWDVSIAHNHLRLSVSGLTLMSVPFAGRPESVVLQGSARIRGFRWIRTEPASPTAIDPAENMLAGDAPADWDWQVPVPEQSMLQREADGSLTLTAAASQQMVRVYVPLREDGLYETLFQVSSAEPGTGVYLGDEQGQPLGLLAFVPDTKAGHLCYVALRPQERRENVEYHVEDTPAPYFVPEQWIRVVAGIGTWHTACGGDLQHFGYLSANPLRDLHGKVRSIGLFCWPSETPRTIRLKSARVHKLTHIYALENSTDDALPTFENVAKLRFESSWWTAVWNRRPMELPVGEWLDRIAISTLEQGPSRELADHLVARLCQSAERKIPPAQRSQVFHDLLMISDHRTEERSREWARRYQLLTRTADVAADDQPQGALSGLNAWRCWVTAPACSFRGHRDDFQAHLAHDVLTLAMTGDWDATFKTATAIQSLLSVAHPDHQLRDQAELTERVARWGKVLAAEYLGSQVKTGADTFPADWRHPAILSVNKEAYNVHVELAAALENQAFVDASRIVAGLQPQAMQGLLPRHSDPDHLVSLNVALQLASQALPEFHAQLIRELTPAGWLRVRQAMAAGDADAVLAATLQTWGTAPAAAAYAWLGDRALSLGQPLTAVHHYHAALPWADDELKSSALPRLQLAEGLAGLPVSVHQEDAAAASSNSQLTAAEVTRMLKKNGTASQHWATPGRSRLPALRDLTPQGYEWDVIGRFDGQGGQNAGRGEFRGSDAFSRQFAIAMDNHRVYIGNRFQVNAYQRSDGARLWARGLGTQQGEAHAFPFLAMQPVLNDGRLYVRSITKGSVELACLQASDGKVLWTAKPPEKSLILTDPIIAGDSAWCLLSRPEDQDQLQLDWAQFSTGDGSLQKSSPVLRLRNAWDGQVSVTLANRGLKVVLAMSGIVVGLDLGGHLNWVRRELWLPKPLDALSENFYASPPVILDDRVILTVPGGRRILCLSLDTGALHWSCTVPDLQGLLVVDERWTLGVTKDSLIAVDPASGRRHWRTFVENLTGAVAMNNDSILVTKHLNRAGERGWLQLLEIDAKEGETRGEVPWNVPEADDWKFGPWWRVGDEVWALTGQTWRDPHRDLVRLKPVPDSRLSAWHDPQFPQWSPEIGLPLRRDLQRILPGWQCYGVAMSSIHATADDVRGEKDVVTVRCDAGQEVRFVRSLSSPATRLTMRIGQEPNQRCHWEVRVNGEPVFHDSPPDETADWRTVTVELPNHSTDQQPAVRIIEVIGRGVDDQPATTCWKSLKIE